MLIKNEIYETSIISYTSEGHGVGKIDGVAVFVPNSAQGDRLLCKIIKLAKSYAIGKIEKILSPSPYRQNSPCPYSEKCGGCTLMHVKYEHQLDIKRKHVIDSLERIGGFSDIVVNETIGSIKAYRYRNKMVFPIGEENGKAIGGFYATKSHRIVKADDCILGDTLASGALCALLSFSDKYKLLPYNEENHTGVLRRIMIRTAEKTGEAMAIISINGDDLPKKDELTRSLLAIKSEKYSFTSIILNINKKKNNNVLGDKNITLYGKDTICDKLLNNYFDISPNSFFQVNPLQTEVLYKKIVELAELTKDDIALDLYCGAGTITLSCAPYVKKIIGIEIVKSAVENAIDNAKKAGIKNAEFILGDAEKITPELSSSGLVPNVCIVDPPRKGLDHKTISALCKMSPEKIVYVSCNPASLARDLKELNQNGYKIKTVQPVDMFPNSNHVETVVLLSKLKSSK